MSETCLTRVLPVIQHDNCNSTTTFTQTNSRTAKMPGDHVNSHQSYKLGPYSGLGLTTMSLNMERLSTAKQQIIADLINNHQCDIVCLQETHRGLDNIRHRMPGMDMAIERPHEQHGSAIFVKIGTIINSTSLTNFYNIEILTVNIIGISVTSIYKPPGELFSFDHPPTSVGSQPRVIIGDFNSHSAQWGCKTANSELVGDWAEAQCLILIHDPKLHSFFLQWLMAERLQPRPHLCYQPGGRMLQQGCDGSS